MQKVCYVYKIIKMENNNEKMNRDEPAIFVRMK